MKNGSTSPSQCLFMSYELDKATDSWYNVPNIQSFPKGTKERAQANTLVVRFFVSGSIDTGLGQWYNVGALHQDTDST